MNICNYLIILLKFLYCWNIFLEFDFDAFIQIEYSFYSYLYLCKSLTHYYIIFNIVI